MESEMLELVDDLFDSVADGTLVALGSLFKKLATSTVKPGFPGDIATVPVRRVAVGADIFETHSREWLALNERPAL